MLGRLAVNLIPLLPKGFVRRVASRYVAGESLDDAVRTVRALSHMKARATIDILGEDASSPEVADETVSEYLGLLDRIKEEGLSATVSLKLTHLGLKIDAAAAEARLHKILEHAKALSNFVTIDMEDSSVTEITLEIFRRAKSRGLPVGAVLQAYLRRTRADAERLASLGAHVRVCKGIYREPPSIAFHDREEIRESFVETAKVLLSARDTFVAFATHDRDLIGRCLGLVKDVPTDRFEFQFLLGVPVEDVIKDLVSRGLCVRVYVPYGRDWYPYATRRLRENPKIASYVIRHLLGGKA